MPAPFQIPVKSWWANARRKVLPFFYACLAACLALLASAALISSCDKEQQEPDLESATEVLDIYIDKNGTIWAATPIGLMVYKNFLWQAVDHPFVTEKTIYDIAYKPCIDGPELWLATGDGVEVADYEMDDVTGVTSFAGTEIGFTLNSTQAISADMNQSLWIGSADELSVYNGNTWYTPVTAADSVTTIANDNRGMNFIGTRNSGVEIFSQDVDAISSATVWTKDWSSLRSDAINHILIVDDTCRWYSTNKGVAFQRGYNFKNPDDWENYTTAEGLVCDTVHCAARDLNGAMWFGTPKGISVYNKATETWNSYTSSAGLIDNYIHTIASDMDGNVWIGTPKGISRFDGAAFTNYDFTNLP